MFYTYILQSEKDGSFYIGYTQNLANRLEQHNMARKGYTASRQPWVLVYHEAFGSKSEAMKRERFLKAQKNRNFYEKLITGDR
jgi:putative endonuclease